MTASSVLPLFNLAPQLEPHEEELLQRLRETLQSRQFILGDAVIHFEEDFARWLQVDHAVAVNSGTDALTIALVALGIGPGDEVILPALTFVATAESIIHAGARAVFADIDAATFTIDPETIAEQINERTRAILAVHLYGQGADMQHLHDLATRHNLILIEDVAQACGARTQGKLLGSWGHASAFSFFPTKNLGALGDAGMLVTHDEEVARRARELRNHGQTSRGQHRMVGYNSRMDSFQGAVLRQRLPLLTEWNNQRAAIAEQYARRLAGVPGVTRPATAPGNTHVYQLYTIRVPVDRREHIQATLNQAGIETGIYYPTPICRLAPYQHLQRPLPATEAATREVLSLPMWPGLSESDVDRVCSTLKIAVESANSS